MRPGRHIAGPALTTIVLLLAGSFFPRTVTASPSTPLVTHRISTQSLPSLARLPISFEPNVGQVDPHVAYLAHAGGMTIFLTRSGAVLDLTRAQHAGRVHPLQRHPETHSHSPVRHTVVRLVPVGASSHLSFSASHRLPGIVNYFIGNNPKAWHTNIPTYSTVTLHNVYPGIDQAWYGKYGTLEYDWLVHPGADPSRIALRLLGARGLYLDRQGNLLSPSLLGPFGQHAPQTYQAGAHIPSRYLLDPSGLIRVRVGSYDRTKMLTIDPSLIYSTYLGGLGIDQANGIAVDSGANTYVTGYTASTNFPTLNAFQGTNGGYYDAFVTKLTSTGSLVYSTYLGGSSEDYGHGIAVDSGGNAYVTGYTYSTNFPALNAFQGTCGCDGGHDDAFVTKLTSAGSLSYSTYLGGSADDQGGGITVDSGGNAYVTGWTGYTASSNFPTLNAFQSTYGGGNQDAFVTKLTSTGSLSYSTYLGGSGNDSGVGIAVDSGGNAYVTGFTTSTDFPTQNAFQSTYGGGTQDAFVTKLTATGSLSFSTYLGGSGDDVGQGIAVDSGGNAYVTGWTSSTNFFPNLNAFQSTYGGGYDDAFVTKLTAIGTLAYSTYLGGSGNDEGDGVAVDSGGNAYVTGYTTSSNFPTLIAFQSTYGGNGDAFVTKLTSTGSLSYSTYLGGAGADWGYGIAVDSGGSASVTGNTQSTNFPTLNAFQSTYGGGAYDAFVTKLTAAASSPPFISASPNPVPLGSSSTTVSWDTRDGSVGQVYVSVNGGAEALVAQGPSGSTSVPWITQPGTYLFSLFAGQSHTVRLTSVTVTRATPPPPSITASPTTVVPPSTSTTITFTTGDGSTGQVYVAMDGGSEAIVTSGASGSVNIPWIQSGHTYLFKLYAGTAHTSLLASVSVTGQASAASISANPTSVPSGTSTLVTWSTGDGTSGQVFVSMDGGSDVQVTGGASGSVSIPWIQAGHTYLFKLYAGTAHTSLLASVSVTGQSSAASISANPTSVPSGTSTVVTWSTGDGTSGQVFVSMDGGSDVQVTGGASGSVSIPWIQAGHTYLFKLYAGSAHTSLLASVTVVGQKISANPTSVPTSGGSGSTAITFSTGDGSTGQVYVSMNGGSDVLVTQGSGSTFTVTWIQHSSSYVFKLYAGTGHTTVLGQVTVTGQ